MTQAHNPNPSHSALATTGLHSISPANLVQLTPTRCTNACAIGCERLARLDQTPSLRFSPAEDALQCVRKDHKTLSFVSCCPRDYYIAHSSLEQT